MTTAPDETETVDEAVRLHEQALSLAEAGELAPARELLEQSLAMLEAAVGRDHPDVANVLNGLGLVAQRQSEIALARRCFRRALRSSVAPRLRMRVARRYPFCKLATVLGRNASRGATRLRRAWRICRPHVQNEVDDNTISRIGVHALINLGNLEREAGNWNHAGGLLRWAVRLARTQLGPDDLDTATALNTLGMWCKFTGRFRLGRRCYRRALTILRRHYGVHEARRSRAVASIYHNIGGLEHSAGNFPSGERFARKSVTIRRRALGTTHPEYASDIGGLAALVADQGRCDEAESLYRQALAIFERVHGSDHYEIAVLLHNLAAVEVARERFDSAWDLYHRAAEMKQRWLGPDHPDLALTLHNLAVLAYDLDRPAAAATFCRQALTIFERNLVDTHPTLLACRECFQAIESCFRVPLSAAEKSHSSNV